MGLPAFMLAPVLAWLSRPQLVSLEGCNNVTSPIIFSACNWYNTWKLPTLLASMQEFPDSAAIVVGGLGRLASAGARALGAEAYEMRQLLLRAGVADTRVTAIGCFECANGTGAGPCHCVGNTGFNVDRLLEHWHELPSTTGHRLIVVEESFLARRALATVLARLRQHRDEHVGSEASPPAPCAIELRSTGTNLEALQRRHGRRRAARLLEGEVARIVSYSARLGLRILGLRDVLLRPGDGRRLHTFAKAMRLQLPLLRVPAAPAAKTEL